MERIKIHAAIAANKQKVWHYYTSPEHITQWNFAHPSWCCPSASNQLEIGGRYLARMEARDGSFGFDFDATYTEVIEGEGFSYEFGGRHASVSFKEEQGQTLLSISFEPETENSIEMQEQGWQAILNNFKEYTENN
jgi:uncharacterized protein YndB with AHSA1/START domain